MLVKFKTPTGIITHINAALVRRIKSGESHNTVRVYFDYEDFAVIYGDVDEVAAQLNVALITAPVATEN